MLMPKFWSICMGLGMGSPLGPLKFPIFMPGGNMFAMLAKGWPWVIWGGTGIPFGSLADVG